LQLHVESHEHRVAHLQEPSGRRRDPEIADLDLGLASYTRARCCVASLGRQRRAAAPPRE
jgi:hypothetical protein